MDAAIARNIQHSLKCYQHEGHFRSLQELYDAGELTNAINRIVEDVNHRFTIEVLTRKFKSGDLRRSAQNLRRDRFKPTDILDMVDIGAESTRPHSNVVSAKEQINRLCSIIEFAEKENLASKVSVDTRSSEVADFVLNHGVKIINDVSGFDYDLKMPQIIANYQAGVIIQHSTSKTEDYKTYNNIMETLFFSLKQKAELAKVNGINNIIIDPGIGFGKDKEDNFIILDKIQELYGLELPIMVGVSRKSLLGVQADDNALKDSLSASISYPLMKKGVDYLRVHNIKLHKSLLNLI